MSASTAHSSRIHQSLAHWLTAVAVMCCSMAGSTAIAQSHPVNSPAWKPGKTTEFIVPSGAGAALDVAARKLTELLTRDGYAPQFVVSNKSGAHSIAALESLHRRTGDAHTLMTLSTSYGNSLAQSALPAHLQKGIPLVTLFREFTTVVVRADSPLRNAQDLIAQLRKEPEKYAIGIATTLGNHIHLGIAQPLQQSGVNIQKLRIVPYKSSAESMVALAGGHLDVVSATTPNLLPYLQSGRVRVLAIAAEQRLDGAFAQAPTWKEQGIDYVSDSFQGVMSAPGISAAQQAYWVHALRKVSESAEWKAFMSLNQWEPFFLGPQETATALNTQVSRSHALLTELGLLSGNLPLRIAQVR